MAEGSSNEGKIDLFSKVVDSLGGDPCLLAIVIVVVVFLYYLSRQNKHIETMEKLRLEQFARIVRGKEGGDDNGTD